MRTGRVKIGSVDYNGEWELPKPDIVEQTGYTGGNYWIVSYAGQHCKVRAADTTAALFWAAKHWGYSFR